MYYHKPSIVVEAKEKHNYVTDPDIGQIWMDIYFLNFDLWLERFILHWRASLLICHFVKQSGRGRLTAFDWENASC